MDLWRIGNRVDDAGLLAGKTKEQTMNAKRSITYGIVMLSLQTMPLLAQDAILPHGDPRLHDPQQREATRDRLLKQHGQGSAYRVEGSRQSGAGAPTDGDANGRARQNAGLSDPSVNPGQATGMRVLRGEVKQATIKTIVVEERNGKHTTITVDAGTAGDRDVRPGDIITGTITAQGRAVAIHKEAAAER